MKKSIVVILVLVTLSVTPVFSQFYYPALTIDKELTENAHSVIRKEINFFKVRSTSEGTFHFRQVITILKKESDDNVLYIPYDKDS